MLLIDSADTGCSLDLSAPSKAAPKIILINIISKECIEIPEGGGLIGRGCDISPEIFSHKQVSDIHCRISIDGADCYIEDVGSSGKGSTNGTTLDGNDLAPRVPVKFYNNSTIGIADLAHLVFDAKIEYPATPVPESVSNESEIIMVLAIKCPECGTLYDADDNTKTIDECDNCGDRIWIRNEQPTLYPTNSPSANSPS